MRTPEEKLLNPRPGSKIAEMHAGGARMWEMLFERVIPKTK